MPSINSLTNQCLYTLGPNIANATASSMKEQVTGMKDLSGNLVNQAIFIGTRTSIATTGAAIENVEIAQQFIDTALVSLKTTQQDLNSAKSAVMKLLNGTVSSPNKRAAADTILQATGMIASPSSRAEQEGSVIANLRMAGTEQSPFYTLETSLGAAPSAQAAPPAAVNSQEAEPLFFNGKGAIPPTTFADPNIKPVEFHNLSLFEVGGAIDASLATVKNATDPAANVDGIAGAEFAVTINGVRYASENVVWTPGTDITQGAGMAVNMYHQDDQSKYITFYLADDTTALTDTNGGEVQAAFQKLFTGNIASVPQERAHTAWQSTLADPSAAGTTLFNPAGITVNNVAPGNASVVSVNHGEGKLVAQIGAEIYSCEGYDFATADAAASFTLYHNGDINASSSIVIPALSTAAALSNDATLYADFALALQGHVQSLPGAAVSELTQGFTPESAYSGTNTVFTQQLSAAEFVGVGDGQVSVTANTTIGAAGTGADAVLELQVGNAVYKLDATTAGSTDIVDLTGGGTAGTVSEVKLYLDGDINSPSTITIPYTTAATGAGDLASTDALRSALEEAVKGVLASETVDSVAGSGESTVRSVPFAFDPGSTVGAGYFTMTYTNEEFLMFRDQFGTIIQAHPIAESEMIASAGGEIRVGNLGTLFVPQNYSGGTFEYQLTTTATNAFETDVTISSSGGVRNINIPNLADQRILWGVNGITIDPHLLATSPSEQRKVDGMVNNALSQVKQTIQDLSNMASALQSDHTAQNATMESLQNLQHTVSASNALEVANNVFKHGQQYNNMMQAMLIMAQMLAKETNTAMQIAGLANM